MREFVSKMKIAGKQLIMRPRLIVDVVRKLHLKALWLPDRQRILIDSDLPKLKWRWNEAHEVVHSVIEWHKDYLHGDNERTLKPLCHAHIEAEANYGAGRLLFMQQQFDDFVRSTKPSWGLVTAANKKFRNTLTSTLWRVAEAQENPALAVISQHPHYTDGSFESLNPCKYFIRSRAFEERFASLSEVEVFEILRNHCSWRKTGPIAAAEVIITDDRGDEHLFLLEAFCHKYDMLSLFSYLRPSSTVIMSMS